MEEDLIETQAYEANKRWRNIDCGIRGRQKGVDRRVRTEFGEKITVRQKAKLESFEEHTAIGMENKVRYENCGCREWYLPVQIFKQISDEMGRE